MEILEEKLDFYRGAGRIKKNLKKFFLESKILKEKIPGAEKSPEKFLEQNISEKSQKKKFLEQKISAKNSIKKILEPLNSLNKISETKNS